jgi:hypothetical protein
MTFRPSFSLRVAQNVTKKLYLCRTACPKTHEWWGSNRHAFWTSVSVNVPHHVSAAFISSKERSGREPRWVLQSFQIQTRRDFAIELRHFNQQDVPYTRISNSPWFPMSTINILINGIYLKYNLAQHNLHFSWFPVSVRQPCHYQICIMSRTLWKENHTIALCVYVR